jgi:hypothetical protein
MQSGIEVPLPTNDDPIGLMMTDPLPRRGILALCEIAKPRFHALEVWKRDLPCYQQINGSTRRKADFSASPEVGVIDPN